MDDFDVPFFPHITVICSAKFISTFESARNFLMCILLSFVLFMISRDFMRKTDFASDFEAVNFFGRSILLVEVYRLY